MLLGYILPMSKRAIAVIGQGFVGGSLSVGMCHAFDVYAYDKAGKVVDPQGRGNIYNGAKTNGIDLVAHKISNLSEFVTSLEGIENIPGTRCAGKFSVDYEGDRAIDFTGIYFIGVPTPMRKDGSADTRIVESVLEELASVPGERIAVVKSTCPPGSTERWNKMFNDRGLYVIFNPEFLTEANAVQDFINQNRIILGGPRPQINEVKMVYQTAFPKIPIIKTSSTTAELVKYTINCFLATKVSFANEMYDICTALDEKGLNVDYDKVIEYTKYDQRIGGSHWAVPGPVAVDGKYVRGFGGHCFPKDMNALAHVARSIGVEPHVIKGAMTKNLEVRPPEHRDWEQQVGRAVSDD